MEEEYSIEHNVTGQFESDSMFMSMGKFSEEIEKIVLKEKITHMEAILFFCEENSIDVEEVVPFISDLMKQKIHVDAMSAGYIQKQNTLPL